MLVHALVVAAAIGQAGGGERQNLALPEVVVDRDDVLIDRSCRVVIPAGTVIRDEGEPGVIQIRGGREAGGGGEPMVVEFAPGSVLRGSPDGADPDRYAGIGVRINGGRGLSVRGL